VADVTCLPFCEQAFDGILSAHTIYHVPADEQRLAVLELFRTLKPGRICVILYAWAACPLAEWAIRLRNAGITRLFDAVHGFLSFGSRSERDASAQSQQDAFPGELPSLYYHAHDAGWFRQNLRRDDLQLEIRSARAVGRTISKALIPDNRLGGLVLTLFSLLEEMFPFAMAKIGRYALITLRKRPALQADRQWPGLQVDRLPHRKVVYGTEPAKAKHDPA
jgi:SAM-dependent methyltransferase